MFRDIGTAGATVVEPLRERSEARIREMFSRNEYVGWLAHPPGDPDHVVSGVGVHLRSVLPFPVQNPDGFAEGRQGLVVNVYTDAEYRRRGLARQLMITMMEWAREVRLDSLVLHAAADGRRLYESLGFKATNEMRLQGRIAEWRAPA
jgi:ribosomal protein S18 acetylase RimI-like enzyme